MIAANKSHLVSLCSLALMCASALTYADQPADRLPTLAQAALKSDAKVNETTEKLTVSAKSSLADAGAALSDAKAQEAFEVDLMEFVETQQPRLLKLLEFMKRKQPAQYSQALKELSKTKQRLANLEKRDVELYKIELQLWQVRSQLRMLVAEIAVSKDDAKRKLGEKFSSLVAQEVDLDTARLTLEQTRARQRVEQIESQLQGRNEDREATIAKSLKAWENRVLRQSPRKSMKPAE